MARLNRSDPRALAPPAWRTMALIVASAVLLSVVGGSCQLPGERRTGLLRLAHEPTIRVLLVEAADTVALGGADRLLVRGEARTALVRTPARVAVAGGGLVVIGPDGARLDVGPRADVVSADPRAGGRSDARPADRRVRTVAVDGTPYAGRLSLEAFGRGVRVVNAIGLEAYVASVASRELYGSWEAAAFAAQAIAARSYALHAMAMPGATERGWDVRASTADQAYAGHTTLARAIEAADATRGRVLAWRGGALRAYYSSTSGGRGASASDVWPAGPGFAYNRAAPLQASRGTRHASEASPYHRWRVRRRADELTRRLAAWGAANGHSLRAARDVVAIEALARNRVGRPTSYRVGERSGVRHVVDAEALRAALNARAPGLEGVQAGALVRSGDFSASYRGGWFTLAGRGFGHGVGMCQFSAQALAQEGWPAGRILANFYPGARVVRVY